MESNLVRSKYHISADGLSFLYGNSSKSILKLICLLLASFIGNADALGQVTIETKMQILALWNPEDLVWQQISKDTTSFLFFFVQDFSQLINRNGTSFEEYTIITKKKSALRNQYEMDAVNRQGKSFFIILDVKNQYLQMLYEYEGVLYMKKYPFA